MTPKYAMRCTCLSTFIRPPRMSLNFSISPVLVFVFLIHQRFTLFDGSARLPCTLALPGTYRAHANGMKSVQGVEGVY